MSYQPDGVTEALTAMPLLLSKPGWQHSEHADVLRGRLLTCLTDPAPHLRFLAVRSLPAVYVDRGELAAAVSSVLDTEDNTDVLTQAVVVLDRFVPPELTDPVLASAGERTAGSLITGLAADADAENREFCRWWVAAHLNCALQSEAPHATAVVRSWFSDPAASGPLFRTALPLLRAHVSFDADTDIRGSVLDLFRTAASALRRELASAPADAAVALAADTMATELYHASGAFEHRTPRPSASQKRRWLGDFTGIIEDLCPVRHPHTCYQLLKTLEFFIDEDPPGVFHAIAGVIKGDSLFQFEELGADVAARILDRYLTDYRQVLTTEPHMLAELRQVLEILAAVGWPSALHLSYSLGDAFR